MSLGSIIGGVAGAIGGFFIGGPMGAIYGASIGFGIGAMVDPMTPDMPSTGAPKPEAAVMKSTVGDICPDLCGTAKITGHLLNYGAERSVAVYSEASSSSSGGKGGPPEPQPQVTGYDYYMSWQLGICRGPIDTLYAIYKNEDDLLWEGPLSLPASGGKETITIDGFGSIDFYFGTDDQIPNTSLGALLDDATLNSPLRNYCWAFMNDCKIGNYPRSPSLTFVVKKIPANSFSGQDTIQEYDANPMHAIYYALNTLCGLPVSWLNSAAFSSVAYDLLKEYKGISLLFNSGRSTLEYVQTINSHIDGILKYGIDGEFHPVLIRDDYDVDNLPVIDEDDMLDDPSIVRSSWIDTRNEIKVQYTEIFNVERTKEIMIGQIWGAGFNSDLRMSDAFASGYRYTTFAQGNTSHPLYTNAWQQVKAFGVLMAIDENNELWSGGTNNYGEAGVNSALGAIAFEKNPILEGKDILYMGPNIYASCCIDSDGDLYTAGWNRYSNLGLYGITSAVEVAAYTKVQQSGAGGYSFPNNWIAASFSYEFGQAIGADGIMYTVGGQAVNHPSFGWGSSPSVVRNKNYFMPVSTTPDVSVPNGNWIDVLVIENKSTWAEKANNSVYFTGVNLYGVAGDPSLPVTVYEFTEIGNGWKSWSVDYDGGLFIGVALDGTLWGSGNNYNGALGLGAGSLGSITTLTKLADGEWLKAGAVSAYGCVALKSDGTLWAAGTAGTSYLGTGLGSGTFYDWTQVDLSGETFEDIMCGVQLTLGFATRY